MKKSVENSVTELLENRSKKVKDVDLQKVLKRQQEIESKIQSNGSLRQYFQTVKTLFKLIQAYWSGEYRQLPWFSVGAIVTALLYVFTPLDFVPDIIPGLGLVDDGLILAACLKLVQQDLQNFQNWLDNPDSEPSLDKDQHDA